MYYGQLENREWDDRVLFGGKALENYSSMFKKHFRNQLPWVPAGFLIACDEELRHRRLQAADTSSAETRAAKQVTF